MTVLVMQKHKEEEIVELDLNKPFPGEKSLFFEEEKINKKRPFITVIS